MANRRMRRVGTVVRDANDKTIVVAYTWSQRHRLYKRNRRRVTKFVAHDENNDASIGDRVEIEECRPYSATKRWRLIRVIAQVDVVSSTEAPEAISETDVPAEDTTETEATIEDTVAEEPQSDDDTDDDATDDGDDVAESEEDATASTEETSDEPEVDDAPTSDDVAQEEKTP